jgi:hypothetical protein
MIRCRSILALAGLLSCCGLAVTAQPADPLLVPPRERPRDPGVPNRLLTPSPLSTPSPLDQQNTLDARRGLQDALRQYEQIDRGGGGTIDDRRRMLDLQGQIDRLDRTLGR